jgi:hypothetical protein
MHEGKQPVTVRDPKPRPVCVYCGKLATTRDHVPPKAIFVELRPLDLITVPSCEACNNDASRFDERFRNIIGMRAGEGSPNTPALWEKTWRSLKRNRRELVTVWRSMRDVPMLTEGGLYVGDATEAAFDAEPHDRTIERITRGLYFHHFGEALPYVSRIEGIPIRDGTEWRRSIEPFLMHMQVGNIGGHTVFEYAFIRAADEQDGSLWIYRFYERHVAAAATGSLAVRGDTP